MTSTSRPATTTSGSSTTGMGSGRDGDGECTATWLPTGPRDIDVMSSEVMQVAWQRAGGCRRPRDRLLSLGSTWLMRPLVAICLDVAPLEAALARRCARPWGDPAGRVSIFELDLDPGPRHVAALAPVHDVLIDPVSTP